MSPKRRGIFIVIAVGLMLLAIGGYFAWHALFTSYSVVQATSPDGKYVTTVFSTFGLSTNRFDIKVVDKNGQLVRNLAIDDKLPGWATDPSITWAADSKTVTVGLKDPDAGVAIKRIAIDVP